MRRSRGRQDGVYGSLDVVFANMLDKVRCFLRVYARHGLEECAQRRAAIRTLRKFLDRTKISKVFSRTGGPEAAIYVSEGDATGPFRRRQFQRRIGRPE